MNRKLIGILSVLVVLAMVLGACPAPTQPPEGAETAGEPAAAPAAEQTEVIWYVRSNDAEQAWEAQVIEEFEAANPNIKINLVVVPWDDFDTKMQTMIAAGTPPDIWSHWGPSGFQDYVKRGLVADLTPFIEKEAFDVSDFEETVLDIYTVDGKIMGMPILTTGSFIFYNKDWFDAMGVDYPPTDWDDTSWTWDAFVEKCGALTSGEGPERQFGCNLGFWPNDAYAWLWGQDIYPDSAYETGFADEAYLNSPEAVAAFQARQDMVWKDNFMPDPAQVEAMGGGDMFQNENVAMELTGGWGWWNFGNVSLHEKFNWGVAALPYGAEGRRDVVFTDPWMLSSRTEHPDEAWTFLKYLASPEVQRGWMELTGAPPVRKSLAEDWYKQFPSMTPEEVQEVHLGALDHGRESPNHLLVRFDQLNQIVTSALDPVFNNEQSAADALPAANEALTEALQQIQTEYAE